MNASAHLRLGTLLVLLAAWCAPLHAQEAAAAKFSKEQLEQLVAPIALHPDALLSQILMASTYPLEVVEADRWVKANPKLKGADLEKALLDQEWDESVKGLCTLPDVLKMMSENLDWTQDLGDAFLAQKVEVMDTVQTMRNKAYDAGNLKSTEQQTITQQPDKIIVIEQPSPEVVYVPSYSPTVVYGPAWSYPTYYYPPMYYPPPPGYGLVSFGVGMAVGAAIWGDCNWGGGWGHGDVDIDIDRNTTFNRNTNANFDRTNVSNRQANRGQGNRSNWQHNPSHRKGVNYRDKGTAQQFGARSGSNRVSRDQARGWSGGAAGNRASAGTRDVRTPNTGAGGARPSTADRAGAGNRAGASASNRAGAGATNRAGPSTRSSSMGSRNTATSGARSPSRDRAASSRGSMSRGSPSFGGSRGGGGMRGGGGGGRRR